MKALVIGGGVCGPVTAMALRRAGLDVSIYEARHSGADDVGSYLTIASNGLDALRAIDADSPVAAASFATPAAALYSGTGKCLGTVPLGNTAPAGAESRTVKRAHLHRAMQEEANRRGLRVEFNKQFLRAVRSSRGVVAHFADGSCAEGEVLIGCDGVHSVTRRLIDPVAPAPRYVGLLNFGGYTPAFSAGTAGLWHMIFGKRAFFGYVVDLQGGTVWFANVPRHASTREERAVTTADQWKQRLMDLFADDKGPARELVATGVLDLAADNTHDLPKVPKWHQSPMIIIGDAAHAPSPTSGQGASLAIEDGVVLAQCLRDLPVARAFETFEQLRRRRVERIVAQGARMSSNKTVGPTGRVVRDLLLPYVFKYLVRQSSVAWIYDHHIEWGKPITLARSA